MEAERGRSSESAPTEQIGRGLFNEFVTLSVERLRERLRAEGASQEELFLSDGCEVEKSGGTFLYNKKLYSDGDL